MFDVKSNYAVFFLFYNIGQYFHLLANATSDSIIGTSTRTPTTVTKAAGDCNPNKAMATATANSKKLLAPIIAEGEQIACGNFNFRPLIQVKKKIK